VKTIGLSNGMDALVDDEDYERLAGLTWHVMKGGVGKAYIYARTSVKVGNGYKWFLMHRMILGLTGKILGDHRDGDTLNNQRHNLRPCNVSENGCNRHKASGASLFKGVSWNTYMGRWKATIQKSKVMYHLGYFYDEETAAWAYDEAAIRLHGEFANLNFPATRSLTNAPWSIAA
jgi:hypothetical protein